jgi:hypothetical protein
MMIYEKKLGREVLIECITDISERTEIAEKYKLAPENCKRFLEAYNKAGKIIPISYEPYQE